MIRILTDHHHSILWEAFSILFIDRAALGPAELWALDPRWPVDREWRTAANGISEAEAVRQPWDYVIGTAPQFRARCRDIAKRTGATYVDQCGNEWDDPIGETVLWSRTPTTDTEGVTYHPEFHRLPFTLPEPRFRLTVKAYNSGLRTQPCIALWKQVSALLPEMRWRIHGEDDPCQPPDVAASRRDSGFAWVDKIADGYGFAVHEAFASGRVVMGHNHYGGKIAGPLWVDGETCLTFTDDAEVAAARIQKLVNDPARHAAMCRAAYDRFTAVVDFDREAGEVADYLHRARLGKP